VALQAKDLHVQIVVHWYAAWRRCRKGIKIYTCSSFGRRLVALQARENVLRKKGGKFMKSMPFLESFKHCTFTRQ
jgi:hypothetical protein